MDAVTQLPIGEHVWADTRVAVGSSTQAASMREVFTDREVAIDGERALNVADALADFPVAVLWVRL
jgi:maltooligosyltrehalose synthase